MSKSTAADDLKLGSTIRQRPDSKPRRALDFETGYWIGYGNGYSAGYAHGGQEVDDAWQAIVTGFAETFRRPNYAEIEARRIPDWRPCPQRCKACSRCIASLAYWSRGGRPYEGVEAELARAS
jgi:hypothetical protein